MFIDADVYSFDTGVSLLFTLPLKNIQHLPFKYGMKCYKHYQKLFLRILYIDVYKNRQIFNEIFKILQLHTFDETSSSKTIIQQQSKKTPGSVLIHSFSKLFLSVDFLKKYVYLIKCKLFGDLYILQ